MNNLQKLMLDLHEAYILGDYRKAARLIRGCMMDSCAVHAEKCRDSESAGFECENCMVEFLTDYADLTNEKEV